MKRIWGVDFDGTLCKNAWPAIGAPNIRLIDFLKWCRTKGDAVILITMREGEREAEAVEWCRAHGLEFDAVNDNLPEMQERFRGNPRKVFATFYIDDRNVELSRAMLLAERELGWNVSAGGEGT